MNTNSIRVLAVLVFGLVVEACGGGGGGDGAPASQPAPVAPLPGGQAPPPGANVTRPLNLALKQGEFVEFAWQTEQRNFALPGTTTLESDAGRFKLTLGASVLIQGQTAFPVTLSGDAGEFAPRWSHLASGSDGSLLGSMDGASLTKIYDAASNAWTGGGMFADFGQGAVSVSLGRFVGAYNDVPAIVASRTAEDLRCEQIFGQQICDDDATRFSEREFYKEGIGAVGFVLHAYQEIDRAGLYTSTTIDKTVELIESTLAATDGTTFVRPPWDQMAPMLTPRSRHAAVVFRGNIWVLGGVDAGNRSTASTEVYSVAGNRWTAGPPLPAPMADISAAVVGNTLVVMKDNDEIFSYPTVAGGWQARTPLNAGPVLVDATRYQDATFGDMLVGAARVSQLDAALIYIGAYDVSENRWYFGSTVQPWRELLRSSVEVVGTSLFVIGGFGESGSVLGTRGALDTIMEFDFASERWITTGVGALNVARDNPATVAYDGTIYTFGGNSVGCNLAGCTPGFSLREAESYDPVTDSSDDLPPMLYPRSDAEAVAVNGLIYVIGGRSGGVSLDTVERFTRR